MSTTAAPSPAGSGGSALSGLVERTLAAVAAAAPADAVAAGLAVLAEAGIDARVEAAPRRPGDDGPGVFPLERDGRALGTLFLDPSVGAETGAALAAAFTLARAACASDESELLDAVLEAVGEGLWVHTRHHQLVNAAARRMLALGEAAPVQAPADVEVRALDGTPVAPDEQPSLIALRTGQPQRFRNRATRADGGDRIFDGTAAPVFADTGEAIGVVMSFRDVTEDHASALLKDRLLERLFENLPTAIAVFDPHTFEARSANRAFLELVGRSNSDVVGQRPPYSWWPEEQTLGALTEEIERLEWLYRRADGTLVPVDLTRFVVRSEQHEPLAVVALVTDVSERRRFEQQLVQTGKLAAIGELAAGVAHEINNPLFAILGLAEFLLKDAEPGSKVESRLQLIQQTGLEIKEIVRALLDFARERHDDVAVVSLGAVAQQTVDLVRRATSAKGIDIVERYPETPVLVEASSTQLKQVILNLVTNAQHALPDGGTIGIEVAREGGWATVAVADDGPGIPPAVVTRIFDPFFTTRRDVGGTGLGLSVSLGIAQTHGGDLDVSSVPGEGATFTLRLPLAAEEVAG